MAQDYSDPRFGVNKVVVGFPTSAALNGTLSSATILATKLVPYKHALNKVTVRFPVGGTAATQQLLVGTASMFAAGTLGAVGQIGTITLGTQANETDASFTISGTVQAGDCVVLSAIGTSASVYTAATDVWGNEAFANL